MPTDPHHRRIRSFVVRAGRLTDGQARALEALWPKYGIDFDVRSIDPAAPPAYLNLNEIFGRTALKTIEIGFGTGENLVALAVANPDRDYLGIEVHRPGVGRLLLMVQEAALTNVRVLCDDAAEILRYGIASAALDELLVLFPDPWHKARHNKRRLIQTEFVRLASERLHAGGCIRLATDWEPYAVQMLEALSAEPSMENLSNDGGYVPRPAWRTATRFERRGERLGHGVWDLAFQRRA